jgi:SAM-dependent methyltransferase
MPGKSKPSRHVLAHWELDELEWLEGCPLCKSINTEVLHENLVDYIFEAAGGKWQLQSCRACECAYLNPRPSRETIGRAYSTYYTHAPSEPEARALSGVRWLRRAIANGQRNSLYGTSLRPSLGYASKGLALLSRSFRNAIGTEAAGLAGVRPKTPGSSLILDIGCGNGLALSRARDAGWRVMGIEPDPNAARSAAANGIDIVASDLLELPPRFNGSFERILLNHVIEHIHDPLVALRSCKDLLIPGGELWLETPNIASVGHEEFRADWRGLEPPRHLVIFGLNSLQNLLREAGFSKINISKPRDVLNYMYERSSHIKNQRIAQSNPSFSSENPENSHSLAELVRRADKLISSEPNRSEFITLTASA